MDFFINTAYAQTTGAPAPGGQGLFGMLMIPVFFIALYLLMIRPQNKRAKQQQEMLSKIVVGDEVATAGGILGKVLEVGDQFLTVEIASGVSVKLQRFQVSQVLPKGTVKNA